MGNRAHGHVEKASAFDVMYLYDSLHFCKDVCSDELC
jgi:hypothetical protein